MVLGRMPTGNIYAQGREKRWQMTNKSTKPELTAELSKVLEGAQMARAILADDLSDVDPVEAEEMRESARELLAQVDQVLELLNRKDELESSIDKINTLLSKNLKEFKNYPLRQKVRFIRIFLVTWLPLKLSGKLKKIDLG